MREIIVKSIMFISSYFPLYVFLAIQQFDAFLNIYNTIKTLEFNKINSFELFFCLILIAFIVISILSVILLRDGDYNNFFCFFSKFFYFIQFHMICFINLTSKL